MTDQDSGRALDKCVTCGKPEDDHFPWPRNVGDCNEFAAPTPAPTHDEEAVSERARAYAHGSHLRDAGESEHTAYSEIQLLEERDAANARADAAEARLAALSCRPLTSKRQAPERIWVHHDGYDWCVHLVQRDGLREYVAAPKGAEGDDDAK